MQNPTTLTLNKEFKRAYYRGRYKASPFLVSYCVKNNMDKVRYGITASKKLGCAVKRNRCRRIIRTAFLSVLKENPKKYSGYDFVFVARKDTIEKNSNEILAIMKKQIHNIVK